MGPLLYQAKQSTYEKIYALLSSQTVDAFVAYSDASKYIPQFANEIAT